MTRGPRRRGSLALRMSLLAVVVVIVTAVVAGGIGVNLIRETSRSAATSTLSQLADQTQTEIGDGTPGRARLLLATLKISTGTIDRQGVVQIGRASCRERV